MSVSCAVHAVSIEEGVSQGCGCKGGVVCIYGTLPVPSLSEAIYIYQLEGWNGAPGWLLNKPIWHVDGVHVFDLISAMFKSTELAS